MALSCGLFRPASTPSIPQARVMLLMRDLSMVCWMGNPAPSVCAEAVWSAACRRARPVHSERCPRAMNSKRAWRNAMAKVACIGGGGVRTPLVIFGINESSQKLGVDEVVLFDVSGERAKMMAALGQAVVRREGGGLRVRETS